MGGKFLPKLDIRGRPIAHKYREGKVQRTLKKESKELEIVNREAVREHRSGPVAQASHLFLNAVKRNCEVSLIVGRSL